MSHNESPGTTATGSARRAVTTGGCGAAGGELALRAGVVGQGTEMRGFGPSSVGQLMAGSEEGGGDGALAAARGAPPLAPATAGARTTERPSQPATKRRATLGSIPWAMRSA